MLSGGGVKETAPAAPIDVIQNPVTKHIKLIRLINCLLFMLFNLKVESRQVNIGQNRPYLDYTLQQGTKMLHNKPRPGSLKMKQPSR